MRGGKATKQKHLGDIPETEFIAKAKQDYLEHNVGGKLKKIERSACTFIIFTSTSATARGSVAKVRLSTEHLNFLGAAVRTGHVGGYHFRILNHPESL